MAEFRCGGFTFNVEAGQGGAAGLLRSAVRRMRGGKSNVAAPSAGPAVAPNSEQQEVLRQIEGLTWYQTIELPHGVATPGFLDHRPMMQFYHLPESAEGLRVLDVATYDGFWAFEFEKRGADVVAIDVGTFAELDLKPSTRARMTPEQLARRTGNSFEAARRLLRSNVRREVLSVYDLCPEKLGLFDVVFCGDLLLHLTNPIGALRRICSVTNGYALLVEPYDAGLNRGGRRCLVDYRGGQDETVWWTFSPDMLERMVADAGFDEVRVLEKRFDLFIPGSATYWPRMMLQAFRKQP